MASAFIIVVHSEFQPDLNEETTALLRIIIHTLNNTAFGNQVPTLSQWTGPPQRIVQVQAILLASLLASLLSAFLAMFGKPCLNGCTPVDTWGTIIQRTRSPKGELAGLSSAMTPRPTHLKLVPTTGPQSISSPFPLPPSIGHHPLSHPPHVRLLTYLPTSMHLYKSTSMQGHDICALTL